MNRGHGHTCPFCQTAILPQQPSRTCERCGIPHHADCWAENGGCTTFGCGSSPVSAASPGGAARAGAAQAVWSPSDRVELTWDDLENRCAICGRAIDGSLQYCAQCSARTQPYRTQDMRGHGSVGHKSPTTACLLNLLLLGAGYFYLGQVGKGILVLLISVCTGFCTYGITTIVGLIYAMVDCYGTAQRMNMGLPR